ncbi:MAG: DUF5995 family protein [Spirosomataceae bacterium]
MVKLARTTDEVVEELEKIIEECIQQRNQLGIFAALYRKVTLNVKRAIANNRFENGQRMELFDVAFANRYLEAYQQNRLGGKPTSAWGITFESIKHRKLILMQHLLMGMNAHISLDLGIAASEVCPGEQLSTLRNDFVEINHLLVEMVDEVQDRIGQVSPTVKIVDWVMVRLDEAIVRQGLLMARDAAWDVAQQLSALPTERRSQLIANLDYKVTGWSKTIKSPPWVLQPIVNLVRRTETHQIPKLIQTLYY